MQPEKVIRDALLEAEIQAFTTLDNFRAHEKFVLIVRTSDIIEYKDVNRAFKVRNYNMLIQCYTLGGKLAALDFSDRVIEVIESIYWNDEVDNASLVGGNPLPSLEDRAGYSLSMLIQLNNK